MDIHLFETEQQFQEKRNNNYLEPWVSLTDDSNRVDYNKTEREKLLETPLTFEVLSPGELFFGHLPSDEFSRTIEYSKNGGEWTSITSSLVTVSEGEEPVIVSGGTKIPVLTGDIVQFRGNNAYYATDEAFSMFGSFESRCKIKGNIMSLINSTNFANLTTLESESTFANLFSLFVNLTDASELLLPVTTLTVSCYESMFYGCTSLAQAPELPATTLATYCYDSMFQGCTSLAQAPELPATTLANYCYGFMFNSCSSLTGVPVNYLPATTLAEGCYSYMFDGCTSLTTAPELPATTLESSCYNSMFQGCTSLTTAPELPATTLVGSCYESMFYGCTSLVNAPALPATTLVGSCYNSMFYGCSNLNYIKCLATNISATNCTYNWVNGVASTGTFVKNSAMTGWITGAYGIPSCWTSVDAS